MTKLFEEQVVSLATSRTPTHAHLRTPLHVAAPGAATATQGLSKPGKKGSRWGVVLAGGDGMRLRSLTRFISGDDRPKQFCRVMGRHTLLEQTRHRAARSIPVEQTVYALTIAHEHYYQRDLKDSPSLRLIQPGNRGTAPPILLSLLHIALRDPGAVVALLPCDHYYSDEEAFTASLESAFGVADEQPESIVLLGVAPNGPEVDFGWIELGASAGENLFHVRGFEEKPRLATAERLFRSGALWNTFVMVGHVMSFLWMAFNCNPALFAALDAAVPCAAEATEIYLPAALYDSIPTTDFSRQFLQPAAPRLLVMPLRSMEWHDLGHPDRVISVLLNHREALAWMDLWELAHPRGQCVAPQF